ncbi:MAG: hypothetical protein ABI706_14325 [Ilumatobacteraceae bacterium]
MEVLLIESAPGVAATLQHRLVRDGHDVISCNDSHGGPCKGVEADETCPMTQHIDVAILARERDAAPSLNEMGSICAKRHRVPLVTLYPGDEFGPGSSTEIAAAVARREIEAGYVAAVRRDLGHAVGDITVLREHQRIHVAVSVAQPRTAQEMSRLADRARKAVRDHDQHTPVIDISVIAAEVSPEVE